MNTDIKNATGLVYNAHIIEVAEEIAMQLFDHYSEGYDDPWEDINICSYIIDTLTEHREMTVAQIENDIVVESEIIFKQYPHSEG
jgi:hypothetical protein